MKVSWTIRNLPFIGLLCVISLHSLHKPLVPRFTVKVSRSLRLGFLGISRQPESPVLHVDPDRASD